jgi:hypothetical protein
VELVDAIAVLVLTSLYTGIPATKKKFAELELQLLHLQQNVEIPETHLIVHPMILKVVQEVSPCLRCSLVTISSFFVSSSGMIFCLP